MQHARIQGFTCESDPDLFRKYLALKYRVFVEEMAWDSLPHLSDKRLALEDAQDRLSHFFIALDEADDAVGIVRGTLPPSFDTLYRHELYDDFLQAPCLQAIKGRVATINALAVLPEYRRSGTAGHNRADQGRTSISEILMTSMSSHLSDLGSLLIVLSAVEGGGLSVMRRLGFRVINPPHEFQGRDYSSAPAARALRIYDLAKALLGESDGKTRSKSDRSLARDVDAYIREREAALGLR